MADVYSFAVMIWQFVTHEEPFLDVSATEAAKLAGLEKQRPPLPKGIPEAIADLIQVNWGDVPSDRLAFENVASSLQEIQKSLSAEEKSYLEAANGHPVYVYDEPDVEESPRKKSGKSTKEPTPRRSSLLSNFFGGKGQKQKKK